MGACDDTDHCLFCKTGRIVRADQMITFKQRTKRGFVFCHVTVRTDTCGDCGLKNWDHDAEAIIENAVRREYERL